MHTPAPFRLRDPTVIPSVELRFLGGLSVRSEPGRDAAGVLAQPKRIALLAYLAAATPHGFHRRDTLLALFWPEADQEHARTTLRKALHFLRQELGPDVVVSRGDEEVGINRDRCRCDVVEFEEAVDSGRLEQAVGLYRGDLLAGFHLSGTPEFERWLDEARTRLRDRATRAAWILADKASAENRHSDAVQWARRAAALSPYDETGIRRLVTHLNRAGDRAGAVLAYEQFAQRLSSELELEPSAETVALVESVRARQPGPGRERAVSSSPEPNPGQPGSAEVASALAAPSARRSWFAARLSRLAWATLGALGLVLLVVTIGRSIRTSWTSPFGRAVVPAAETIAILPFNTAGPRMEFLGEGMMDLLATNLGGVGGIRTVEPRAVLRTWGRRSMAQGDGLEQALAVGRELEAASIVIGSAVSIGERVRLAADLYSTAGDRLGRALVDGPADSVLQLVDRLSVTLVRDVWRSRAPLPNLRLAALTTDSPEALRSYLQGEAYYRRLEIDSALAAYKRAVEVDSTFALAHLRLALVYGWTHGYGSELSREMAAGFRFVQRLPPRDRRLLAGYRLFERGKPASVDSLRAFVEDYPDDIEGWNLLGESMFHTRGFRPVSPDSIVAAFDSVLRRDSTLLPPTVHPVELALSYRDSATLARYSPVIERSAQPRRVAALRTAAAWVWGPRPADSAVAALMAFQPYLGLSAGRSAYLREDATSDSVLAFFSAARAALPTNRGAAAYLGNVFAGLGRLGDAKRIADTLMRVAPDRVLDLVGWPMALGIAPATYGDHLVDSIIAARPPGPSKEWGTAMTEIGRGRTREARRRIASALAMRDTTKLPEHLRGILIATDGWARLVEGDSVGGLLRLRAGVNIMAAPVSGGASAFFCFQLALALAAQPATRREGIHWLRYGFDLEPLYLPLSYLALGQTYEAARQRDSAAFAYGRFVRLWDKADPSLQDRVHEAREALAHLTAEPASR